MARFEAKGEIKGMVDLLMEETAQMNRGDVIPLEYLERLTGLERHVGSWKTVIRKLKKRFRRERGIQLWVASEGAGYKLATQEEQLQLLPAVGEQRIVRQYSRTLYNLQALPPSDLNPFQRKIRAAQIEALRAGRRSAKRDLHEQSILFRKRETVFGNVVNNRTPPVQE